MVETSRLPHLKRRCFPFEDTSLLIKCYFSLSQTMVLFSAKTVLFVKMVLMPLKRDFIPFKSLFTNIKKVFSNLLSRLHDLSICRI